MCGPECCRSYAEDVYELFQNLTGGKGLGDPFDYRGLRFLPVPHGSECIGAADEEMHYVAVHGDRVLLMSFVWLDVYLNYADTGDFKVESVPDLERYIDEKVFGKV